jgi:hypothetical protein
MSTYTKWNRKTQREDVYDGQTDTLIGSVVRSDLTGSWIAYVGDSTVAGLRSKRAAVAVVAVSTDAKRPPSR